jgi:hypothetical protein
LFVIPSAQSFHFSASPRALTSVSARLIFNQPDHLAQSRKATEPGEICRRIPDSLRPIIPLLCVSASLRAKSPVFTARLLLVLALRLQKPIVWDAEKRQAVGIPAADAIIDPKPSTDEYLPR